MVRTFLLLERVDLILGCFRFSQTALIEEVIFRPVNDLGYLEYTLACRDDNTRVTCLDGLR